ncbi:hypothetical protein BGU85_26965, partial [Clostridioides difficile]|uniref:hypothetical protein n=1 Tax=Clostridioides difficile TaxID=1496 RepID=UPI000BC8501A
KVVSIFTGSQLLFEDTARNLKKYMPKSEIILYYGASELNYITFLIMLIYLSFQKRYMEMNLKR